MTKVTGMPPDTSPSMTDLLMTIDIETLLNKKVTLSDLTTLIFANAPSSNVAASLANVPLSENFLMNGNFNIWQRATTFTPADDTYIADRWNCLQEANNSWTFARDTDVPTANSKYSLKATNVTANNQCGIVQILEGRDTAALAGGTVSLSFYAKTSTTEIAKLRVAILSWTGTEDAVTSDVIATWAQNGSNPTWATNWTLENVPSDLNLTATYQKFTIENVAIDTSGVKNVAVVAWVDDGTITAGDRLWISQMQLVVGTKAMSFKPRLVAQELALCQRFYEKSFNYASVPGNNVDLFYRSGTSPPGAAGIQCDVYFKQAKRTTPSITLYGNANNNWEAFDGAWGTKNGSLSGNITEHHFVPFVSTTAGNGFNDAKSYLIRGNWTADAEL
jgi:hypothetical protein